MVTVKPLTVHWHQDSAPIYSVGFESDRFPPVNRSARFATAGGDNNVRVWRLKNGAEPTDPPQVEYLATLSNHEGAVNAVRFNDEGTVLASAGDDGIVCLWAPNPPRFNDNDPSFVKFGNDFEDQESWRVLKKCRTANFGEIYDLAWSPSGRYLAATSMDKVVSIIDTVDGICIDSLRDHKHYVQGVAWDPRNKYIATQSSDQTVLIYQIKTNSKDKIELGSPKLRIEKSEIDDKVLQFHSESFSSFFRRLSFSPDGALLVVPAGLIKSKEDTVNGGNAKLSDTNGNIKNGNIKSEDIQEKGDAEITPITDAKEVIPKQSDDNTHEPTSNVSSEFPDAPKNEKEPQEAKPKIEPQNCLFIYSRGEFKHPKAVITLPKESLAVRFSPVIYTLRGTTPLVNLSYRMVYAVATLNGVFLYDTEQAQPIGMAANLHYSSLTDLAWSPDGRHLLVTSIDGFCSVLRFDKGELGVVSKQKVLPEKPIPSTPTTFAPVLTEPQTPKINTLFVRKKKKPVAVQAEALSAPMEPLSTQPSAANTESPTEHSSRVPIKNSPMTDTPKDATMKDLPMTDIVTDAPMKEIPTDITMRDSPMTDTVTVTDTVTDAPVMDRLKMHQ